MCITGICRYRKGVASCDMWLNDKIDKFHIFYCIGLRIVRYMYDCET
jgi:hypothetical protein